MKKIVLSMIAIFGIGQSIYPASIQDLNSWFKRLKKGTRCLIKREKCSSEDTKAVWQAGMAMVSILTVVGVGGIVYVYRKKLNGRFAKALGGASEKGKEVPTGSEAQEIINAVRVQDIAKVKELLRKNPTLEPNTWETVFFRIFYDIKNEKERADIFDILYSKAKPELYQAKYNLWHDIRYSINTLENMQIQSNQDIKDFKILSDLKQLIEKYIGSNPQPPS